MLKRAWDKQLPWRTPLFTTKAFDRQLQQQQIFWYLCVLVINHRGMRALINDESLKWFTVSNALLMQQQKQQQKHATMCFEIITHRPE